MALTDGLQALWHFNSSSVDSSSNSNNITFYGTAYDTVNQKLGSACADFDGFNDYGIVTDHPSISITGALTIGGWLYIEDKTTDQFVCKKSTGGYTSEYGIRINGNSLIFYRGNNSTAEDFLLYDITALSAGWHHFIWTVDSSKNVILYLDNSNVANTTFTITPVDSAADLNIGKYQAAGKYYKGLMDEFAIWNRDLSSAEVSELWNGGSGIELSVGARTGLLLLGVG